MKLQSYYFSTAKSSSAQALCELIAREYKVKGDQIPPAYQPEREAVVFISFDSGKPDAKLLSFCKSLTAAKTKSVAFAVIGADDKGLSDLKALVEGNGIKVHENVYHAVVKGGLFSKGNMSDQQLADGLKWAHDIIHTAGME